MNDSTPARSRKRARFNTQAFGIFGAAAFIYLAFGLLNPRFLGFDNLRDVAVSACVNALIGLGMTFVIITGGIDLSVGSIASFSGIVAAQLMVAYQVPSTVALVLGLAVGFVCGLVNGVLVAIVRLPPFIATLGTMSVYQGLAYVVTNGIPVYNVPDDFVVILNGYIGGVPTSVLVVVIVAVLCWLLLRRTVFGQNVIATGGSEETAWLSGVRVNRVKILVYGISGLLASLGGLIVVARISAAQSEAGAPYQMTAIASAVIGGANLMGGEGRIGGTLIGALILGALTNGLVLLNVPSFYEQIVTGLVVIVAVALDQTSKGWPMLKPGRKPPTATAVAAGTPEQPGQAQGGAATTDDSPLARSSA